MFPDHSAKDLKTALTFHGTLTKTALALASGILGASINVDSDIDNDELDIDDKQLDKPVFLPSLQSVLKKLSYKMSIEKVKISVEEDDLLNDALAFYKSQDFDPRKKLRIKYKDQPAVDTGGVVRQFFTELLKLLTCEFFHGDKYKSPIYNSQVVASGMMKLCGKIIVHSIMQGGPGMPIFSPSIYYYLATGDSEAAVERVTIQDCSMRIQSYISKVSGDIALKVSVK